MELQPIVAVPKRNYNSPCIDCQKPCRGERCRRCLSIHMAGPLPHCAGCDTELLRRPSRPNQTMWCETCRPASRRRKKLGRSDINPQNITTCVGCGRLVKKYREGKQRCRLCANKDPARRAKASVSMKVKVQEPEYAAKHERTIERALVALHQPHIKALAQLNRDYKAREERRLAWCPEEYRDLYKAMMKQQVRDPEKKRSVYKWTAKDARAKIESMFGGPLRPFKLTVEDASRSQCQVDGQIVKLSPVQLTIMLHLVGRHPDHYTTNEEFIRLIWPNANMEPGQADATVKSHIHHLRHRKGVCIVNAHGKGYRLAPQVRLAA